MVTDKRYAWLNNVAGPKIVVEAIKLFGTLETPGDKNNPVILAWAKEVSQKVANVYKADSIPWCGLFLAVVAQRAGFEPVTDPLWALNWNTFGTRIEKDKAMFGDVLVFVRNGGGHVALYVGEDKANFYVLGGNQSDRVNVTKIAKDRLYGVRRCPWKVSQPKEVKKVYLNVTGAVSTNEQ